jgi:hypothetical protein
MRLDRGRDGTQGAASAIELIHERQHHRHTVFLDPQFVVKLAYETDTGYVRLVKTHAIAVALRKNPTQIDPTLKRFRLQAPNHFHKLFLADHDGASCLLRGS